MAIFYAIVAKKNNIILCDYTSHTGNFQQITMQLLKQIQPDTCKTLELEDYMFHYTHQNGILVLCMADNQVNNKLAFTFLEDIRQLLVENYTTRDIENAKSYSLKSFGTEFIKPRMQMYNSNPNIVTDKADQLFQNMMNLKENMVENIESLIERDGKIEIIAEKALQLSAVSNSFKQKSKKLKEQERKKRMCYIVIVSLLLLVFVLFGAYALFGGGSSSSSDTSSSSNA